MLEKQTFGPKGKTFGFSLPRVRTGIATGAYKEFRNQGRALISALNAKQKRMIAHPLAD